MKGLLQMKRSSISSFQFSCELLCLPLPCISSIVKLRRELNFPGNVLMLTGSAGSSDLSLTEYVCLDKNTLVSVENQNISNHFQDKFRAYIFLIGFTKGSAVNLRRHIKRGSVISGKKEMV